jgi:rod shape determining protein RodA
MTYIAGARSVHLLLVLLAGGVLFAGMWHFDVIRSWQKNRVIAFVDPSAEPSGAGYQVRQSRIAVGSGQVWGKGFGKGTQSQGRFIPENHTDFVFTVVGEEGGFALSTSLVLLYALLLFRGASAMAQAEDTLGKLLVAGVVSMFAFHVIINIGMTIGIMPVTGIPLPLFSYGGSSLLINMIAIGLVLGVGMRRHRLTF